MRKDWAVAFLACVLALGASESVAQQKTKVRQKTGLLSTAPDTTDLLSVVQIGDLQGGAVALSPDAKFVALQVLRTDLPKNRYASDLLLLSTDGRTTRQLTRNRPVKNRLSSYLSPQWSPDSRTLAHLSDRRGVTEIWLTQLPGLETKPLMPRAGSAVGMDTLRGGAYATAFFKWSPDGGAIAFLAAWSLPDTVAARANRGINVGVDWYAESGFVGNAPRRLCLVELARRVTRCLTDTTLNVESFDWSPDGRRFAISASAGTQYTSYMATDVYVMDRTGTNLSPLVVRPGPDREPVWSPDGKWIAFLSQDGEEDWLQNAWPSVVAASGGPPRFLGDDFARQSGDYVRDLRWAADGSALYFVGRYHMSSHLFRIEVHGGRLERVTPDSRYYRGFSFAAKDTLAAFIIESPTDPPELYVSEVSGFRPRRLTALNQRLARASQPTVGLVTWRSSDGRWDVHGVVMTPRNRVPGRRCPLVVFVEGGPSAVQSRYNLSRQYSLLAFVERGYMILAPNTRGRPGYGRAFHQAIGSERSYGTNPLKDVLDGVDFLVRRGDVDSARMGIVGFSYGGYLTAYAATQTDRFAAASVGDGTADIPGNVFRSGAIPWAMQLFRQMWGLGSPYDADELRLMMQQSPIYNVHRTRVPVLLEYGLESLAPTQGRIFFQGLQRFGIPSEFVVYPRTGHGVEEPKLREDSITRNLAWFDYWLLGRPYPDRKRQAEYDKWKEVQGTRYPSSQTSCTDPKVH